MSKLHHFSIDLIMAFEISSLRSSISISDWGLFSLCKNFSLIVFYARFYPDEFRLDGVFSERIIYAIIDDRFCDVNGHMIPI